MGLRLCILLFISCNFFVTSTCLAEKLRPWMRFDQGIKNINISPNGKFIAFEKVNQPGMNIIEVNDLKIYKVSHFDVSGSAFWSPDGYRLFYREQISLDNKVTSNIKAYDAFIHKDILINSIAGKSGFLTFDSRDLGFSLLHSKGIFQKKIEFPDKRLEKWQSYKLIKSGKWVASKKGVFWYTAKNNQMKKMNDDQSLVESFAISKDGLNLAWHTSSGRLYVSHNGSAPKMIGYGKNPKWHPTNNTLVYSGAVKYGSATRTHDIMIMSASGKISRLTDTISFDEDWPDWLPNGKQIVFTRRNHTDTYIVDIFE